jgi:DNA-directed RNA polymerase subunit L
MSKKNITIKEVEYIKNHNKSHTLETDDKKKKYTFNVPIHSKLILDITGSDVTNEIINTLRRIVMDDIPTYAFPGELIKISDNTTIYDNDMMRKRLIQLPVLNTKLDLYYLDPVYWHNVDYTDPKRPKHDKEQLIEIAINVTNDTQVNKNITTNDIKYYVNGEEKKHDYNKDCPILLLQLKPADSFKCTMKAVLGTGERNNIWAGASTAYYDDYSTDDIKGGFKESNKVTFTIESQGMMTEYELLIKACKLINKKLEDLKQEIEKKIKTKEIINNQTIILDLQNEDHTLGNIINWAFQSHPKIVFSGVAKPDHLIKAIKIKISSEDASPIPHMFKQIDYLVDIYKSIEDKLEKLSK